MARWGAFSGTRRPLHTAPPPPGPNASPVERARATGALRLFRQGRSPRGFLLRGGSGESEAREKAAAGLMALGSGITPEEAEERLEKLEGEE